MFSIDNKVITLKSTNIGILVSLNNEMGTLFDLEPISAGQDITEDMVNNDGLIFVARDINSPHSVLSTVRKMSNEPKKYLIGALPYERGYIFDSK